MKKLGHILKELLAGISHTMSAMLNTIVFGGDMFTSTSARAHLEQDHPAWANRRKFINALFFWQEDHCKLAWETDYRRALTKVEKNRP
jgi:hypothetical protein